jgi:hypothetical protein
MLSVVDGDVFGRVTNLGRAAAEAVARAVGGASWDAFDASRCIDALLAAAPDGIPSLVTVASELAALRDSPLLARVETDGALRRIHEATLASGSTELDLILRSHVVRSILHSEFALRTILDRFCGQLLERAILTGRGGFMEHYGSRRHGSRRPLCDGAAGCRSVRRGHHGCGGVRDVSTVRG